MAGSIGDWYADHALGLPDDFPDDEVVERHAAWDLRSSGVATTRSARRDAGLGGGRTTRSPGPLRGSRGSSGTPSTGALSPSVRSRVQASIRANPRADAASIAAALTRAGHGVTAAQVAAVGAAAASASRAGRHRPTTPGPTEVAARIRDAARAHPQLSTKKLAALLRARGTVVTKAQVAQVLAREQPSGNRRAAEQRKPAVVIKVTAGAQGSRTVHETPLCQSCGVRLSVYSTCRCS